MYKCIKKRVKKNCNYIVESIVLNNLYLSVKNHMISNSNNCEYFIAWQYLRKKLSAISYYIPWSRYVPGLSIRPVQNNYADCELSISYIRYRRNMLRTKISRSNRKPF